MSPKDPHAAPRPPRGIEAAMEAAGAAGDQVALFAAQLAYGVWLEEQGWKPPEAEETSLGWYAEHERREDDR